MLRDLAIHDVNGNVYDKHMNNGGIYMTALSLPTKPPPPARLPMPVRLASTASAAAWRWATPTPTLTFRVAKKPSFLKYENVTIRDNYVKLAGGDGITVMYALRPLVEHNTADSVAWEINESRASHPGDRAGKVAAGIWPWKCKDALFRCNEAADTRLNQTAWLMMPIRRR